LIWICAYCRFRADTAADVADGRHPCAFQLPRLPSPSTARRPAAVIGKKLLILCIWAPSLMLRIRALLHGFDHVHLDLGYFSTKGLQSAWQASSAPIPATTSAAHRRLRLRGDVICLAYSPVSSFARSRCDCGGMLSILGNSGYS